MDTTTTQVLSILVILFVLATTLIISQTSRRRRELNLRPIPAYDDVPGLVGLSIESSRPIHLSLGSTGIGGPSTLLTVVSAELFYQISQRAAIGDTSPIITLSDASALPLGQDTLRRAYQSRGMVDNYRYQNVRWYPSGTRSLAYAAAISAIIAEDRVSSNVLSGRFGAELALIMEAGVRRDLPGIAVSDQVEGQAVAYAFSEHALIGEEVFAAGAYLDGGTSQVAATVTIDILRWILVVILLVILVGELLNSMGG